MAESDPAKVIISNPFWYLCDMAPGCLCSHRRVGTLPKYKILPSNGRAVLDILSEDLNEEKQILSFEPLDNSDAITEAMHFAERYEAVHSES